MSRPKSLRRVNLESCQKLLSFKTSEATTMSPMTNLAQNLSGASLDSTPKRKLSSQGKRLAVCPDCSHLLTLHLILLSDLLDADESIIGLSG